MEILLYSKLGFLSESTTITKQFRVYQYNKSLEILSKILILQKDSHPIKMAKDSDLHVILKPFPPEKLFPKHCLGFDWKLGSDVQIRVNLENIKFESNENVPQECQEYTENLGGESLVGVEILPVPTVLDSSELFAQYHEIVTDYESNCTVCHQLIHLLTQHIRETHKQSRLESEHENQKHSSDGGNGAECHEVEEVQNLACNILEDTEILDNSENAETTIGVIEKDDQNSTVVNTKSPNMTKCVSNKIIQKSPTRRACKSKYRDVHVHEAGKKCPKCPRKGPANTNLNQNAKKQTPEKSKSIKVSDLDPNGEIGKTDKKHIIRKKSLQKLKNKSKKTKQYLCKICNFKFRTQPRFETHVEQKHKGVSKTKSFSCHLCPKATPVLHKLNYHYRRHHKGMPRKLTLCKYCDLTFFNYIERKAHMVKYHPEEVAFICKICKKIFRDKTELMYHERQRHSTEEKQFNCTEHGCEKSFFIRAHLNVHMKFHKGRIYNYKCQADGCNRSFCTATQLKIHTRKHTGEKPFMCEVCGKAFAIKLGLKTHLVIHQEENGVRVKPWICDCCDARFALKGQLKLHYLKHTGERRHLCQECGKRFILPSHLRTHLKTHLNA